jgi:lipopolysaccharide transport system permease protein
LGDTHGQNGEGRRAEKLEAVLRDGGGRTAVASPPEAEIEQVIEPTRGWVAVNWPELWRFRELVFILALRDIQVRYKQTALGAAWAVLQPLMTTMVFALFFGRLAGLDQRTGGTSYFLYVFAGLLPWLFFANSVTSGGKSMVANSHLVSKVYFPRLVIPLGTMGAGLVDFAVSLVVLAVMMAANGVHPSWQLALAPVIFIGLLLLTAGVGSLLAALTVSYRDFQHLVPFAVQIWMFITPVIYPSTIIPARWRWLYMLNPMAGLVDGFRSAFLAVPADWFALGQALALSAAVFLAGVTYFRSVERRFADVV